MRLRLLTPLAALGCAGPGSPPRLLPIGTVQVFAGTEVQVPVQAIDPDGDRIRFSARAPDLPDFSERAALTQTAANAALLRFVPESRDVGRIAIDLRAEDDTGGDGERMVLEVLPAAGAVGAPVFVSPLGDGATVDLAEEPCVTLPIVVDDPDSLEVAISIAPPGLEGAVVTVDSSHSATLTFCPTPSQALEGARHAVGIRADDGAGPPTVKRYVFVLREALKPACAGDPPHLAHEPPAAPAGAGAVAIEADVWDDLGLKHAPVVYFALGAPGAREPDPTAAIDQMEMKRLGESRFRVEIPVSPDAAATLLYRIVAQDNDDPHGDCDHRTESPPTGFYPVAIDPGDAPAAAPCAPCASDAGCGGGACVLFGGVGASFCLPPCQGGCPAGMACSPSPVASLSGASAYRCLPDAGVCGDALPGACHDDAAEDNDAWAVASPAPTGAREYVLCPGGSLDEDEDFFRVRMAEPGRLRVGVLTPAGAPDVDVSLRDSNGRAIGGSFGAGPIDRFERDLPPGEYAVRVFAADGRLPGPAPYTLEIERGAAAGGGACVDAREPNDDAAAATAAGAGFSAEGLWLCPGDEDWFSVAVAAGEQVVAEIECPQGEDEADLDLYLVSPEGTELTPCCDLGNGQSADCHEIMRVTVPAAGSYRVVVRGYDGASGRYAIAIGVEEGSACETQGCDAGEVCAPSGCVPDACAPSDGDGDGFYFEQGSCPGGHFCPLGGPAGGSHCVRDCLSDGDCLPGTVCKVFDTVGGCAREGASGVGQSCSDFTACAGALSCLPTDGGYCTLSDCDSTGGYSGPCPGGGACIPVEDDRFGWGVAWLCLAACESDLDCRVGYECVEAEDDLGEWVLVCA